MPSVPLLSLVQSCSSVKQFVGNFARFGSLLGSIAQEEIESDWQVVAMEAVLLVLPPEVEETEDHPEAILLDPALAVFLT